MIAFVTTAAAATFLTALAGSPHCALMCGPLACAAIGGDTRARRHAALGWQLGRLLAYGTLGAILGALGRRALAWLQAPSARVLPWIIAAGLVLSALEAGRRLPALPGLGQIPSLLARLGARFSPTARAALRGAATPFLPCGLLYGAFVTAIGAGSIAGGGTIMIAFALGSVPALALVQLNTRWLTARPPIQRAARRVVPLVAAAFVVWRSLAAAPGAAPACHHTLDENRLVSAGDFAAR